mmetsp:Transcript_18976/g.52266  ORF Transcript_18976/g.52266 Transcript_18976/m.52266 type:complete len:217 (+) Transcript_18976:544-1194(+)
MATRSTRGAQAWSLEERRGDIQGLRRTARWSPHNGYWTAAACRTGPHGRGSASSSRRRSKRSRMVASSETSAPNWPSWSPCGRCPSRSAPPTRTSSIMRSLPSCTTFGSGRARSTRAASSRTTPAHTSRPGRRSCSLKPRSARWKSTSSAPAWRMAWLFWTWAVGGAPRRCTSPSGCLTHWSSVSPTRTVSVATSSARPRSKASRTSASSLATSRK